MRLIRALPVVLLGCCWFAEAQEAAPPVGAPTIQVQSQLVVLDTVVTDHSGNVVRGLTKDDFVVYENGVPQTIRSFTSVEEQPPVPAAAKIDRNGHDNWGTAPLTMIVVDAMDTPFEELAYARDCVKNYLKKQPAELATPTILLWLDDAGLHPLTTLTRDRDTVMTALLKQPPALPSRLTRGDVAEQVAASFAALQQAALFSRGEPGKKLMIWVGRSFPTIDPINLIPYDKTLLSKAVKSTADLLLDSRVTLYVVDPTVTGSAMDDDGQEDVDTLQMETASTARDPFASTFNISLFVNETGGKYFRGRNDLDQQIADSERRGLAYYTLTYVPSTPIQPGAYRKIDIRFKRPGLIAQVKKGYYGEGSSPVAAGPPSKLDAKLDENDLRFDLYEASIIGMQYTGLGLHVVSCEKDAGRPSSTCVVSLDTGTLTFAPYSSTQERSTFMTVLASLDSKGKLVNDTIAKLTVAIPEAQVTEINAGATQVKLHTVVPPGTKSLRVVVRDASGRIGTAEVPAEMVPRLVAGDVDRRALRRK